MFDENEAVSYVFLDFAEGAFADAGGNVSAALVGGVDEETQTVAAPYWEYTAAQESDFTGTFGFFGAQLFGAVIVGCWAAGMGFIIFKSLDKIHGLRVPARIEEEGLDIYEHGESAYN